VTVTAGGWEPGRHYDGADPEQVARERAAASGVPLPDLPGTTLRGRLRRGWDPVAARLAPENVDHRRVLVRDARVYRVLQDAGAPLTKRQIAHRVGSSESQARRSLDRLREHGLVELTYRAGLSVWYLREVGS
jgi:DNA-binding transcriptional ArsR family regulator